MQSSPSSRRQSRRLSNNDSSAPPSPVRSFSRRSSQYSTITPQSSHGFLGDASVVQALNGFDSLADELEGAWEEDDDVDESVSETQGVSPGLPQTPTRECGPDQDRARPRDSGIDVSSSPAGILAKDVSSSPTKWHSRAKHSRKHSRRCSRLSDSDFGGVPEEAVSQEMPSTLKAAMADIEGLAKNGVTETTDGTQEETIARAIERLKDLGGQAGIETGTSRLVTAHNAVSSYLAEQTRTFQSVSYALLSPHSFPIDELSIDELLSLIVPSISALPQPSLQALSCFNRLSHDSRDVIALLNNLSDSLHLSRQTQSTAARMLKSARETVAAMRKEDMACEEGIKWIDTGEWQKRLAERECARVCKDVVGGFEEVCDSWRERLFASAPLGVM